MKILLTIFALLTTYLLFAQEAQTEKDKIFKVYTNLLGGRWETKGKWERGQEFHQEVIITLELTKNLFIVKTKDFIDAKQFDHAQRNYGIRAWDDKEKKMKFWEFDVFGGITTGEIRVEGNNIYHVYQYQNKNGEMLFLADAWIYIDKDTYSFKVCEFVNNSLGKEYMATIYKRK